MTKRPKGKWLNWFHRKRHDNKFEGKCYVCNKYGNPVKDYHEGPDLRIRYPKRAEFKIL